MTDKEVKQPLPTVTIETDERVFTLEGKKEYIEKTSFQMSVVSQLAGAKNGVHTIEGVKVTVRGR